MKKKLKTTVQNIRGRSLFPTSRRYAQTNKLFLKSLDDKETEFAYQNIVLQERHSLNESIWNE